MWTRKTNKDLATEYVIKDVCAGCNNGFLSTLDGYMCDLYDQYVCHDREYGDRVTFRFDYHRLKRWVLKMSYNSARLNDSFDAAVVFPPLLGYLRGDSALDGRSVQLFVELTPPGLVPLELMPDAAPEARIFRPLAHRVGHRFFRAPDGRQKVLRVVHLRAFVFTLAFFEPRTGRSLQTAFAEEFCRGTTATLLRPSRPSVVLECTGLDAWSSIQGARETQLVFDG